MAEDEQSPRLFSAAGAALIILAGLTVYWNSLSGAFFFDDFPSIPENPTIRRLDDLRSIFRPPGDGLAVENRPIVNLSLALNYAAGGERVWGYHAFNLAVHLAAALLLFGCVRRTLGLAAMPPPIRRAAGVLALVSALIWVVHPLGTEAVTYLVQRTESLMAMFYLLTFYAVIRGSAAEGQPGWVRLTWFAVAVMACVLGMGCKEGMVTAPVMVLLYDRIFLQRSCGTAALGCESGTAALGCDSPAEGGRNRPGGGPIHSRGGCATSRMRFGADRWALYAGLAGSWVALAGVIWVLGSPSRTGVAGFGQGMGVWPYARTQFGAILMYLKLSVWPDPLIVDYGVRLADGFWQIWPAAAGVAVLLAATAWALIRRPMAGFVGAWVFGILAPTSTVIPLVMQTVAEKRMYLPLAGLVALAVVGVFQFGRWVAGRLAVAPWISGAAGLTAAAVIVAVLGWRTIVRNGDYDSPLRLWQDTVNKNPGNYRARGELGHYLTEAGRIDEAFGQLDEAIRLNPAYPQAYNHRGSAYAQRGDTETARSGADLARARADYRQAVADYTRAIDLNLKPTIAAKVYNNRGNAYASLDEFSRAIADYGSAIRLVGGYVKAYYNRGCTRLAKGDTRDAIADFTKAIELAPGQPRAETFNNRANAYRRNGDYKRAIADYTRAIELNPELAGAYINRAIAYDAREEFGKALADVARAIELNPNLAGAYSNRAVVFFHQKDYAKAWADVKKCQALGGEVPPDFLADLRAATGGYR